MKRNYLLLVFILICLSLLSGNLTAGVSLVGKIGISFFYKQFSFFKAGGSRHWYAWHVCWSSVLYCTLLTVRLKAYSAKLF